MHWTGYHTMEIEYMQSSKSIHCWNEKAARDVPVFCLFDHLHAPTKFANAHSEIYVIEGRNMHDMPGDTLPDDHVNSHDTPTSYPFDVLDSPKK